MSSSVFSGASGSLSVGYFANDMAATESQGPWSMGYTLDPLQNRIATATATNTSTTTATVNDYADNGDNPAWSTVNGVWTRDVAGPGGMLDATVAQAGSVTLQLANLQGSEVATAADSTSDTGIDTNSYATYNEYGTPTNTAASAAVYGWLGGNERSTNSLGGLTLMGVRLYDSTTGRFLSADPVYGGNANPYIYPTDPIDMNDVTGKRVNWTAIKYGMLEAGIQWAAGIILGIVTASVCAGSGPIGCALFIAVVAVIFAAVTESLIVLIHHRNPVTAMKRAIRGGPSRWVSDIIAVLPFRFL